MRETITSAHNPLLKRVRRLIESTRERRKERVAVLDGVHLLEAYAARFSLENAVVLLVEGNKTREAQEVLRDHRPGRLIEMPDALLNSLSPLDNPTGVMAVVPIPNVKPVGGTSQFWIVLDGVQDPGNMGSILRTAAASGATRAVLSPACADAWSLKSLRGGMGAQFALPIEDNANLLEVLKSFEGRVYAADARGGMLLYDADLKRDVAIVLGAEGAGLAKEMIVQADAVLRIPIAEGVESLNVAAAAAMICGERIRQRQLRGT